MALLLFGPAFTPGSDRFKMYCFSLVYEACFGGLNHSPGMDRKRGE